MLRKLQNLRLASKQLPFLIAIVGQLVVGSLSALAQEKTQPLVSAEWLSEHLDDDNLVVVDLAHRIKNYHRGHIFGAVFINWKQELINPDKADRYSLPPQSDWEKLLSKHGVKPDTHLVLTDNMDSRAAVRMYWTAKYFGHERVSVLDGGTDAWQAAGNQLSTAVPETESSQYKVSNVKENILTSLQVVRKSIENKSEHLIDGRPTGQFSGEAAGKVFNTGKEHKRRGHIVGALNIPWSENLNDSGKFKSIKELKELYAKHGVDPGESVITYCNEGLHAAMPWFVLHELLGEKDITLYDDSMAEWANRDDTPMERDK